MKYPELFVFVLVLFLVALTLFVAVVMLKAWGDALRTDMLKARLEQAIEDALMRIMS